MKSNNLESATFGGGCFWCIDAIFQEVDGIEKVISGYAGGNAPGKPTYREVCSGLTGHAEVVQLTYDPKIVSYEDILTIFMTSHDPTTLNRQGADVGTQYRSVIYYHNNDQKEVAQDVKQKMSAYYSQPIVTEISPLSIFYEAEDVHQDYYRNNRTQGYCSAVITPKLVKLRQAHSNKLKKN